MNREVIDINAVFQDPANGVSIDENERLRFAKQVLFGMAFICLAVFTAYASFPENKALANIFELVKIGALPLITLVVSFYFPNANR